MVQEYGEIDLARLLAKHDATRRAAAGADLAKGGLLQGHLDENFIRLYWQQMLQVSTGARWLTAVMCVAGDVQQQHVGCALQSPCASHHSILTAILEVYLYMRCHMQAVSGVHDQRIVHSDLKPANFLLVEGQLKLIDFGIAKAICGDTTSIARESQVGQSARTLCSSQLWGFICLPNQERRTVIGCHWLPSRSRFAALCCHLLCSCCGHTVSAATRARPAGRHAELHVS
eukprot:GHRQ01015533.1.p1 GENE.GHRQ01015533.1~~GHRQ01015533.1.p1  ORF type:complete len:230 (+),score=45.70 GHRQ01015533.1:834-1523(+)